MQKTLKTVILSLFLATTSIAAAPFGGAPSFRDYLGGSNGSSSLGLIDPGRISFDHSLQMGVVGFSGGSMMQSLYSSTARYKISDPVTMSFTLGMMGTKYSGSGAPALTKDIIGGVALDYHPTSNFNMRIEVSRAPGYYGLNRYSGTNEFFGNPSPLSRELNTDR